MIAKPRNITLKALAIPVLLVCLLVIVFMVYFFTPPNVTAPDVYLEENQHLASEGGMLYDFGQGNWVRIDSIYNEKENRELKPKVDLLAYYGNGDGSYSTQTIHGYKGFSFEHGNYIIQIDDILIGTRHVAIKYPAIFMFDGYSSRVIFTLTVKR